jgi:hypothetical protein
MAVDEALWLSKVETEIYGDQPTTLQIRNVNKAAIAIIQSGMYQARNRHIGLKYRWLHEMWTAGEIEISYTDTSDAHETRILADGLGLTGIVRSQKCLAVLVTVSTFSIGLVFLANSRLSRQH